MSGIKERREGKAKAAPASTAQASTAPAGTASASTATTTEATPQDNVRTRELRSQEQMGAGILWALFAVDEAAKEDSRVPKLVHAAKLFLIAVIFIAPVLLMWQHAF